jgi:hypothetical protein
MIDTNYMTGQYLHMANSVHPFCLPVDTGNSVVYVWRGEDSSDRARFLLRRGTLGK